MNTLQPFTFPDTGQPVRTLTIDGAPWFLATDVCTVLGIGNPSQAVSYLDDDERSETLISNEGTPGNPRKTIVTEAGLYSLILRSRKPEARAFKRWITHDVLPSIRRTGGYGAAPDPPDELELAERNVALIKEKRALSDRAEAAENRAAALEPSAEAWEHLADAHGDYPLREAAQILSRDHGVATGQNRLARTLRELGWTDPDGQPYQAQVEAGRLVRRTRTYTSPKRGEERLTSQIRITPKGLQKLRELLGADTTQLRLIDGHGGAA